MYIYSGTKYNVVSVQRYKKWKNSAITCVYIPHLSLELCLGRNSWTSLSIGAAAFEFFFLNNADFVAFEANSETAPCFHILEQCEV